MLMKSRAGKAKAHKRDDAVFIRKSTAGQDEGGQKANVQTMLKQRGVCVPERFWFEGTVGRRKVRANETFTRLMKLVEADKIGTVYVESQDRWGTADRVELFTLIGVLREHKTRLFDLKQQKDLTAKDYTTELISVVKSFQSEDELKNISYRSLRTRVNNFKETGSWPTGPHPFGYGKACYAPDGALLWVWQPISKARGQLYYPTPKGALKPVGPADAKIPRKERRCKIVLLPNTSNPAFIESVRLIFDLYTRVGLSRRQISTRLNTEGRRFYDKPFTHPYVTQVLGNPAYAGDTHFGKTQTGELHTFDSDGMVVPLGEAEPTGGRDVANRIIKVDTHEPLIDRKTWKLAQAKLAAEQERTSYAPRNPAYYLKQIFVCGHCGKGMTARTEVDRKTKRATVVYVCSTYINGRCNGHTSPCGYHRIAHDEAERLLLDKITEMDLQFDNMASVRGRDNLRQRLARLGHNDDASAKQWNEWVNEGIAAFIDYMRETYDDLTRQEVKNLEAAATGFYTGGECRRHRGKAPADRATELREWVIKAEQAASGGAKARMAALRLEHEQYTGHGRRPATCKWLCSSRSVTS